MKLYLSRDNGFHAEYFNKMPKIWIDYVVNHLMKEDLWAHYFLWEAFQVIKSLNKTDLTGLNILEPGCGNGIVGCLLSLMGANVSLFDYSEEVLDGAKKHARNLGVEHRIRYIKGDIFEMSFDEKYDLVWNDGVIEHFDRPEDVIKQMMNSTKNGGKVLVTVPAKYSLHTFLIRPYLRKKNRFQWDKWGEEKSFSEKELQLIMTKSGLRDIHVFTSNLRRAFLDDNIILPILSAGPRRADVALSLMNMFDMLEVNFPILQKAGFVVAGIGTINE